MSCELGDSLYQLLLHVNRHTYILAFLCTVSGMYSVTSPLSPRTAISRSCLKKKKKGEREPYIIKESYLCLIISTCLITFIFLSLPLYISRLLNSARFEVFCQNCEININENLSKTSFPYKIPLWDEVLHVNDSSGYLGIICLSPLLHDTTLGFGESTQMYCIFQLACIVWRMIPLLRLLLILYCLHNACMILTLSEVTVIQNQREETRKEIKSPILRTTQLRHIHTKARIRYVIGQKISKHFRQSSNPFPPGAFCRRNATKGTKDYVPFSFFDLSVFAVVSV